LGVLRGMAEQVHKTGSAVLIDKYAQKTALRLGVAPDAVRAEFKKLSRARASAPGSGEEVTEGSAGRSEAVPVSTQESWLLRLMLANDDLVPWVAERLDLNWVRHAVVRRILEARISCLKSGAWAGVPGFLDTFEDEEAQSLITEAVADRRKIADPAKTLKGDPGFTDKRGILEQLRDEFVDGQMATLRQRLSSPQASETDQIELWRQMQELRSLKGQPLGPEAEQPGTQA